MCVCCGEGLGLKALHFVYPSQRPPTGATIPLETELCLSSELPGVAWTLPHKHLPAACQEGSSPQGPGDLHGVCGDRPGCPGARGGSEPLLLLLALLPGTSPAQLTQQKTPMIYLCPGAAAAQAADGGGSIEPQRGEGEGEREDREEGKSDTQAE